MKTLSDFFNNKTLKTIKTSSKPDKEHKKKKKSKRGQSEETPPEDFGNDVMPPEDDEVPSFREGD